MVFLNNGFGDCVILLFMNVAPLLPLLVLLEVIYFIFLYREV